MRLTELRNPFVNDPLALVWLAFTNLYPDKECDCYFATLKDEGEETGYGLTTFFDDSRPAVYIDISLPIYNAAEILAHELAHIAVGADADHNEEWESAFEAINVEYDRLGELLYGGKDWVKVKG